MADEEEVRTFKQKLLFYTTAFFILLATFSLFAFLFLVPFVIDPAFTTIFMQFDENPALCFTVSTITLYGSKNCSWASCREGCTKDIYQCTQIRVNYKLNFHDYSNFMNRTVWSLPPEPTPPPKKKTRYERGLRDYADYDLNGNININNNNNDGIKHEQIILENDDNNNENNNIMNNEERENDDDINVNSINENNNIIEEYNFKEDDDNKLNGFIETSDEMDQMQTGLMGNDSEWYFTYARLFPNVKGCGYPPMLNCSIWLKQFIKEGTNFSCYYSKVDPGLVISDLDYWQNTLNLVYSMAIPIPSFIISVIYLTFAYFKIYNEDEEKAPLDQNAEDIADDGDNINNEKHDNDDDDDIDIDGVGHDNVDNEDMCVVDVVIPNGTTPLSTSGPLTPNSTDINSFGHQLKVQMADEMSRESLDGGVISNSGSLQGYI